MFYIFKNRLEITGTLTTITALRISQGRSMEPIGSDLPVIKDALGNPLIPGSSFKGAMRSRLEAFLRGIDTSLARDPSELVSREMNDQVKALKEQHQNSDQDLTDALNAMTDEVSIVFGTPWQSSKFQVQDLSVNPDTWFGQYQERDGVSIDRDTETAVDGRLYDFQVVPAGVEFGFRAIFENADNPETEDGEELGYWELGLIMVGLQQFKMRQVPLGGGCSRGLGVVELSLNRLTWVDPEGDQSLLLAYLERLGRGDLSHYVREDERIETLQAEWSAALIRYLSHRAQQRTSATAEV